MTTIAWSKRVDEIWADSEGNEVQIIGEAIPAKMVMVEYQNGLTEWLKDFDSKYHPVRCESCGQIRRASTRTETS